MTAPTPPKRGGAGRGQGRKPADGQAHKTQCCVLLTAEHRAYAKTVGAGNMSLGLSMALDHYRNTQPK